jgi:hypothetical protein
LPSRNPRLDSRRRPLHAANPRIVVPLLHRGLKTTDLRGPSKRVGGGERAQRPASVSGAVSLSSTRGSSRRSSPFPCERARESSRTALPLRSGRRRWPPSVSRCGRAGGVSAEAGHSTPWCRSGNPLVSPTHVTCPPNRSVSPRLRSPGGVRRCSVGGRGRVSRPAG